MNEVRKVETIDSLLKRCVQKRAELAELRAKIKLDPLVNRDAQEANLEKITRAIQYEGEHIEALLAERIASIELEAFAAELAALPVPEPVFTIFRTDYREELDIQVEGVTSAWISPRMMGNRFPLVYAAGVLDLVESMSGPDPFLRARTGPYGGFLAAFEEGAA